MQPPQPQKIDFSIDASGGLFWNAEPVSREEAALRFSYVGTEIADIGIRHHNLANYLGRTGGDPRVVLAHRLAAALIFLATGSGTKRQSLAALARNLRDGGQPARAALPADFAALCATVQEVEGVRFAELMARLLANQEISGDELLRLVITKVLEHIDTGAADAAEPPAGPPSDVQEGQATP